MEAKLLTLWDQITDQLVKKNLSEQFVADRLEPYFNYNIFKQRDTIGNTLLNYAIVYKSTVLVKFILKKINFEDLEEDLQKRLTDEVMHLMVDLSIDVEKNGDFLFEVLKMLGESTFKNLVFLHTTKAEVAYFLKHFDLLNKKSFKVLGEFLQVLEKDCKLDSESSPYFKSLKEIYTVKYGNLIWENLDMTKFSTKKDFYHQKEFFPQNILEHAILKGKFDEIINCGVLKEESLLLEKGVLELIMERSPIKFLKSSLNDNILKKIADELITSESVRNPGRNFIHMLIRNKKLKLEEMLDVLNILSRVNIKPLLNQPDYFSMLPLTLFLYTNTRRNNSIPLKIVSQIVSLLIPQLPEKLIHKGLSFIEIYKEVEFHRALYFKKLPKEYQEDLFSYSTDLSIYNINLIRAAISFGNEDLFLGIWDRLPQLNLNCYCICLPNYAAGRFHLLKDLLEAGFHRSIDRFLTNLERDQILLTIDIDSSAIYNEEKLFDKNRKSRNNYVYIKNLIENRLQLLNLPQKSYHMSIFDSAFDALSALDENQLANDQIKLAKSILLLRLKELVTRMSNQDLNNIFLNMSFSSIFAKTSSEEPNEPTTIFFSKIFRGDDSELIDVFSQRFDSLDIMNLNPLQSVLIIENLARFNSALFLQECSLNCSIRSIYTNYWSSHPERVMPGESNFASSLYQACKNKGEYLEFLFDSPGFIETHFQGMIQTELLEKICCLAKVSKDTDFIKVFVKICVSTLHFCLINAIEFPDRFVDILTEGAKENLIIRSHLVESTIDQMLVESILINNQLQSYQKFLGLAVDEICDRPELLEPFKSQWVEYTKSSERNYEAEAAVFSIRSTNLSPSAIDDFLKSGFSIKMDNFRFLPKDSLREFYEESKFFSLMIKARRKRSASFIEEALKTDDNLELVEEIINGLGFWQIKMHPNNLNPLYLTAIQNRSLKIAATLLSNEAYIKHLEDDDKKIYLFLKTFFEGLYYNDITENKGVINLLSLFVKKPRERKGIPNDKLKHIEISFSRVWQSSYEFSTTVMELMMSVFKADFEGDSGIQIKGLISKETLALMYKYLSIEQIKRLSSVFFNFDNQEDSANFLKMAIVSGEKEKILHAASGVLKNFEVEDYKKIFHLLLFLCKERFVDVCYEILSKHRIELSKVSNFPVFVTKLLEIAVKTDKKDVCLGLMKIIREKELPIDFGKILSSVLRISVKSESVLLIMLRTNALIKVSHSTPNFAEKLFSFPVHISDFLFEKIIDFNKNEIVDIYQNDKGLFNTMKILESLYLNGFYNKLSLYYKALFTGESQYQEIFLHFYSKITILIQHLVEIEFAERQGFLNTKGRKEVLKGEKKNSSLSIKSKVENLFWNNYNVELEQLSKEDKPYLCFSCIEIPENNSAVPALSPHQPAESQEPENELEEKLKNEQDMMRILANQTNNRVKSSFNLEKKIIRDEQIKKTEKIYEQNKHKATCASSHFQKFCIKSKQEFGEQNYKATLDRCGDILFGNIEALLSPKNKTSKEVENDLIKRSVTLMILAVPLSYSKFIKFFSRLKSILRGKSEWEARLANIALMILLSFVKTLRLFFKGFPIGCFNKFPVPPDDIRNCIDFIKNNLDDVKPENIDETSKSLIHNILADLYSLQVLTISVEFWSFLRTNLKVPLENLNLNTDVLCGFLNQAIEWSCKKSFLIYVHMLKSVPKLIKLSIVHEEEIDEKIKAREEEKSWDIVKLKKIDWKQNEAFDTAMKIIKSNSIEYFKKLLSVGFLLNQPIEENRNTFDSYLNSFARRDKGPINIFEYIILIKRLSLVPLMIENFRVEERYLLAAVESGSYEAFVLLAEAFFDGNKMSIFEYIVKNQLVMKLASVGNEEFLLKLFEKNIGSVFQVYRENKGVFYEEYLVVKGELEDSFGRYCNIFHFIALKRMRRLLHSILEYYSKFIFKLDKSKIKTFLETFLHMKISKGNIENGRTPLYYALLRRFYEFLELGNEYKIGLKFSFENDGEPDKSDNAVWSSLENPAFYSYYLFTNKILVELTPFNRKYVSRVQLFEKMRERVMQRVIKTIKSSTLISSLETHQMIEIIVFGAFLKNILSPETIFNFLNKLLKEPVIELIYLAMEFFLDIIFTTCQDKRSLRRFINLPSEEYLFYAFEKFEINKQFFCEQSPLEFYNEFSKNETTHQDKAFLDLINDQEIRQLTSELLSQDEKITHLKAKSWGSDSNIGIYFDQNELFDVLLYAQERNFTKVSFFILKLLPETFLMRLQESGSKIADLDRSITSDSSMISAIVLKNRKENLLRKALTRPNPAKSKYRETKSSSLVKSPKTKKKKQPVFNSSSSLSIENQLANQQLTTSFLTEYCVNNMLLTFYFLRASEENLKIVNLNNNFDKEFKIYTESFITAIPFQKAAIFKILFSVLAGRNAKEDLDATNSIQIVCQGLGTSNQTEALDRIMNAMLESLKSLPMLVNVFDSLSKEISQSAHLERLMSSEADQKKFDNRPGPKLNIAFYKSLIDHLLNTIIKWYIAKSQNKTLEIDSEGLKKILHRVLETIFENPLVRKNYLFLSVASGVALAARLISAFGIIEELTTTYNDKHFVFKYEEVSTTSKELGLLLESHSKDLKSFVLKFKLCIKQEDPLIFGIEMGHNLLNACLEKIENILFLENNGQNIQSAISDLQKNIVLDEIGKYELVFDLKILESLPLRDKKTVLEELIDPKQGKLFYFLEEIKLLVRKQNSSTLFKNDDMFAPHNSFQLTSMAAMGAGENLASSSIRSKGLNYSYIIEQQPDSTYEVRLKLRSQNSKRPSSHLKYRKKVVEASPAFSEFYVLQNFPSSKFYIHFVPYEKFLASANEFTIYGDLQEYDELTHLMLKGGEMTSESLKSWGPHMNFTISPEGKLICIKDSCVLYTICKTRGILAEFEDKISYQARGGARRKVKIGMNSFYEVFLDNFLTIFQNTRHDHPLLQSLNFDNTFSLMEYFLENTIIKKAIELIIYETFQDCDQLLMTTRGIFIEFFEVEESYLDQTEKIDERFLKGLDKVFRLGRTKYVLNKNMLIIRFSVCFLMHSLNDIAFNGSNREFDEKKEFLDRESSIAEYLMLISNKFDFFEQILAPEQIIAFVLDKIELEKNVMSLSKKISEKLSKVMTLSINFESLNNIFKNFLSLIRNEGNRLTKIKEYERVWSCLDAIKKYFTVTSEEKILKHFSKTSFDEYFYSQYLNLYLAYCEAKPLSSKIKENTRIYEVFNISSSGKRNSVDKNWDLPKQLFNVVALKSLRVNTVLEMFSYLIYSFFIKIDINSFFNQSRIGDIFIIGIHPSETKAIQVASKRNGRLYYVERLHTVEELTGRTLETFENGQDETKKFRYKQLSFELIKYAVLVTKKWPDPLLYNFRFDKMALSDGNLNFIFIKDNFLQSLAEEVLKNPIEVLQTTAISGLFPNGSSDLKAEFTVSNLIQSFPSTINFEFEQEHEIPLLLQSGSLIKQQSLMQSLIKSENFKTQKIIISEDFKISIDDISVGKINLSSKLDLDLIFNYDLKYFCKKIEKLLRSINYPCEIGTFFGEPPKSQLDLSMEFSPELEAKSSKYESIIRSNMSSIFTMLYNSLEKFITIGNDAPKELLKSLILINSSFNNESNALNSLIAGLYLKYIKVLKLQFVKGKKMVEKSSADLIEYNKETETLTFFVKVFKKKIDLVLDVVWEKYVYDLLFEREMIWVMKNEKNKQLNLQQIYKNNCPVYVCNSFLAILKEFLKRELAVQPLIKFEYEILNFESLLKEKSDEPMEDKKGNKKKKVEDYRVGFMGMMVLMEFVLYNFCIALTLYFHYKKQGQASLNQLVIRVCRGDVDKVKYQISVSSKGVITLELYITSNSTSQIGIPSVDYILSKLLLNDSNYKRFNYSLHINDVVQSLDSESVKIRFRFEREVQSLIKCLIPPEEAASKNLKSKSLILSLEALIINDSTTFNLDGEELIINVENVNKIKAEKCLVYVFYDQKILCSDYVYFVNPDRENNSFTEVFDLLQPKRDIDISKTAGFLVNNFIKKSTLPNKDDKMKPKMLLHKEIEDNIYENINLNIKLKLDTQTENSISINIKDFGANNYKKVGGKLKTQKSEQKRWFRTKWIAKKIALFLCWSSEMSQLKIKLPTCRVTSQTLQITDSIRDVWDKDHNFSFIATKGALIDQTVIISTQIGDRIINHAARQEAKSKSKESDDLQFLKMTLNQYLLLSAEKDSLSLFGWDPNSESKEWELTKDVILINGRADHDKLHQIIPFNYFSVVSEDSLKSKNYSLAGEERKETIQLKDDKGNTVAPAPGTDYKVFFVHKIFKNIMYPGEVSAQENQIIVTWRPYTKGIYNVLFNGVFLTEAHQIVIFANRPYFKNCSQEIPEEKNPQYFQKLGTKFIYRDEFFNIVGDVEKSALYEKNFEFIKLQSSNSKVKLVTKYDKVEKIGTQGIRYFFENENIDNPENEGLRTSVTFYFMEEAVPFKEINYELSGLSLEKRRDLFKSELRSINMSNQYQSIKIRRINFVEDLQNLHSLKLNRDLTVNFEDEQGIDAGGLKREFFDMVGKCMMDSSFKFFKLTEKKEDQYMIHPDIIKHKEGEKYMRIFGMLLANSIYFGYLIGIDFAPAFWKSILGKQLEAEDLQCFLDEDTCKNYFQLKELSNEDLDSLEQYFVIRNKGKDHDLIENGSSIKVTKENLNLYLEEIVKFYFLKEARPQRLAFIEGFDSIFPLSMLSKWFMPSEISIFTCGEKKITYENLIKIINFSGGNSVIINFFKRYLEQSPTKLLEGFVKFTTGSSHLPYETKDFRISVEFVKTNIKRLPISHTCFKSIEVPTYPSYEDMKTKLDITFTVGTEGFGFG